jgi:hypothetical protein
MLSEAALSSFDMSLSKRAERSLPRGGDPVFAGGGEFSLTILLESLWEGVLAIAKAGNNHPTKV